MSTASAEAFINATKTDRVFLKKVLTKDPEERKKVVKAAGYDFTMAELQQAAGKAFNASQDELSSEDLDRIAAACIGTVAATAAATAGATIIVGVVGTVVTDTIS
jgi:predicted ribosomally synthesized peptide with nif11-like leader